ncbi:MAG: hypothetical protein E7214_10915 [Clostridium sp.]|nr:hypothetical protein [Clostridium sp.]
MNKKEVNKLNELWERSNSDNFMVSFRRYFSITNIRFRFALRMSIILSISILVAKILGYYKIIWLIITIMSIIQPYYEDTKKKALDRIIGNVIGILFSGSIIRLVHILYI